MAFSREFLDDLKRRVGLVDVVARRVSLARRGRRHVGLCPFHREKTPSFTVNEEKGFYHCFGCGAHGTAIDFAMQIEGLAFPEAVARLAAEAGLEVPEDTPQERELERRRRSLYDVVEAAAAHFEKTLRLPEGQGALAYLRRRGVDDANQRRFRLGFASATRGVLAGALQRENASAEQMVEAGLLVRSEDRARAPYERFRGRLMFPIWDHRGRVIAFGGRSLGDGEPKYLNSPETPLFRKGRTLYALPLAARAAREAGTLVVAEGYMDVIALHRAGFENAVAPLGTALTEEQMTEMWRLVREPILCFDGDAAGARAAARAATRALSLLRAGYGLRFARLPPGEDPDTLVGSGGAEAMARVLSAALPLSDVLWQIESGGRVPKTPEQRASLQRRLNDHIRTIDDPLVRRHFGRAFGERIWQRARAGPSDREPTPSFDFDPALASDVPIDKDRLCRHILLAVLINHPEIYDEAAERLGTVVLADDELDRLRQHVLAALAREPDLDSHGLEYQLRKSGFSGSLDGLLSAHLYDRALFARRQASREAAIAGWEETFNQLCDRALKAELREAELICSESPTDADWGRLLALKQQLFQLALERE